MTETAAASSAAAAAAAGGPHHSNPIMDTLSRINGCVRGLERELLCGHCGDVYRQPVVLPCGHNLCLLCATELAVQGGGGAVQGGGGPGGPGGAGGAGGGGAGGGEPSPPDPASSPASPVSTPSARSPRLPRRGANGNAGIGPGNAPRTERLERLVRSGYGTFPGRRRGAVLPVLVVGCPVCQREVELGERGLSELLRNLTLERLCERQRQAAAELSAGTGTGTAVAALPCQACRPPRHEAAKACADCRLNYCKEGFKLAHPWGTPKAQHEAIAPTLSFRPKVLMCPEHDQERVSLYCKTCQRLICQLCKLRRVHTTHKVTTAANAYQALKDKLTKAMSYILANQNLVQIQIQTLDHLVQQTQVGGARSRESVGAAVGELSRVLEEKQHYLLQALDECQRQRVARLDAQITQRHGLLEHSPMIAIAQEVMKENDHACFIQAARQLQTRISRATESLQNFSPAAGPSFNSYQLDVSGELKLLGHLQFVTAPDAPVIDTQRTYAYDQIYLCWRLPKDSAAAWHYEVENRQAEQPAHGARAHWQRREEVRGTGVAVGPLETDRVYALRVRGVNKAGHGAYSEEVYLRSPPAPVLHFLLDSKWGFSQDRLVVSKDQRAVRSVAGTPMLFAAERVITSCHLSVDLVIGDVALTQGKHYWACSIDPGTYLAKVGVGLESKLQEWFHIPQDVASPRYDPDSGHDSGAEDATVESSPPYAFLTVGMGKVLLPPPPGTGTTTAAGTTAPLPSRLGVCLDYERGRVAFYDAVTLRGLWEGGVDCSGPVCPAFCFMGGGALHLQEMVAAKPEHKAPPRAPAETNCNPFGTWNSGSAPPCSASVCPRPDSGTPI